MKLFNSIRFRHGNKDIKLKDCPVVFPPNRATQTYTPRSTLIESYFLTGAYLTATRSPQFFDFLDGKDTGKEIDLTRLQSLRAPDISSLITAVNADYENKSRQASETVIKYLNQKNKTVSAGDPPPTETKEN